MHYFPPLQSVCSPSIPSPTPTVHPMKTFSACLPYQACLCKSDSVSRSLLARSLLTHTCKHKHTPTVSQWPDFHWHMNTVPPHADHRCMCNSILVRTDYWLLLFEKPLIPPHPRHGKPHPCSIYSVELEGKNLHFGRCFSSFCSCEDIMKNTHAHSLPHTHHQREKLTKTRAP